MMNLEQYRALFIITTLGLALIPAYPLVGELFSFRGSGFESFSEFWLLGSNHMADGYPFNVRNREEYQIIVGVFNHMSTSEYYKILVKLSNSSELLPNIDQGEPSFLPSLYEFRFFIDNNMLQELVVTFSFNNFTVEKDVLVIGEVMIDDAELLVDASTVWNSEENGNFFHLFFELWRYDIENNKFKYENQFVGLWLNIEAP